MLLLNPVIKANPRPVRRPAGGDRQRKTGLDTVQSLLEAVGMGALGLGERLEPVRDLAEALVAGLLRHTRIHVRVFVRLARDGGLQIQLRLTDRQTCRGITNSLEILEVAMRVAGLA